MKNIALTILACVLATCALAVWSTDPANPNLIAGFPGEQSIPKVAITSTGNTYVSRFDNNGGSYKVYLQLFAADGEPLWTDPNGLLVSNHSQMSWITEYDLTVDNDGNAVVVFQDIRNAGANNVVAYKISPTGEFLWGADGIALTYDTNTMISNMSPVVFNSNDNTTYAAWQHIDESNKVSIGINRLSATGQKLWGENGIILSNFNGSYTWPQIIQSNGDNILLKYYWDTGSFPAVTRRLNVAKLDVNGVNQWNSVMTDAGGYSVWQQLIPFKPDGTGGAVLAWYDERASWDYAAYCQRVNGDGQTTMGDDGTLITFDTAQQQFYPKLAIDHVNQNVYAFFRVTDSNQDQTGLGRQLLDYSGTRLWGDTAPLIIPIGADATDCSAAYYTSNGAVCIYRHGTDNVYATCWRASGISGWAADSPIALTATPKDDVVIDKHPDEWIVVSWSQGSTDYDICAMRLNSNGSLGMEYAAPRNLIATLIPPDGVQLDWQAPSQTTVPDNYYVYMNDELAQVVAGNVLTYQILGLSPGTYDFYIKALYGDNYSEPSNTATVMIVSASDPAAPPVPLSLSLYPNPFQGSASLCVRLGKASDLCRLSVYDVKGRLLWRKDLPPIAGEQLLRIDPQTLGLPASGIYYFQLETATEACGVKAVLLK